MVVELSDFLFIAGLLWFAPLIITGLWYLIGAFFGIMKQGFEDRRKP